MIVPAAVPKSSTAVKTNVSETEIRAGIEGTLIAKVPEKSVSAAKTNHIQGQGSRVQLYDRLSEGGGPGQDDTGYVEPAAR